MHNPTFTGTVNIMGALIVNGHPVPSAPHAVTTHKPPAQQPHAVVATPDPVLAQSVAHVKVSIQQVETALREVRKTVATDTATSAALVDSLSKRLSTANDMITSQSNELGVMRKAIASMEASLKELRTGAESTAAVVRDAVAARDANHPAAASSPTIALGAPPPVPAPAPVPSPTPPAAIPITAPVPSPTPVAAISALASTATPSAGAAAPIGGGVTKA